MWGSLPGASPFRCRSLIPPPPDLRSLEGLAVVEFNELSTKPHDIHRLPTAGNFLKCGLENDNNNAMHKTKCGAAQHRPIAELV